MRSIKLLVLALVALCASSTAPVAAQESVSKVRVAAENAFAGGDMKKAISLLSKLIELEPTNERNFYKRYRAYLSERKYSHALSDLTSSLAVNPSYKQGIAQRGKLLMMLGQCADAAHDFERVVQLFPTDATAQTSLAKSTQCATFIDEAEKAQTRGDYTTAHAYLTQVLDDAAVSSVPLLLERAQLSITLQQPYDAIADLGTVLKLDPSNLVALQRRGEVLYALGDAQSLAAAVVHFRQGLHSDPEHKGLKTLYRQLKLVLKLIDRARAAMASGQYGEAVEDWTAALAVDPTHAELHKELYYELCVSEVGREAFTAAAAACRHAIQLDETSARSHAKLSDVLLGLEQYEEAVRAAKRALELESDNRSFQEAVAKAEAALKQSKTKNYYKILSVSRTANSQAIKKAYRKLALEWHPDKHSDKEDGIRETAQTKFHDITEAYEVLSSEDLRARYDRGEDVTGNNAQSQNQQQHNPFGRGGHPFGNGFFHQQQQQHRGGGHSFHFNF